MTLYKSLSRFHLPGIFTYWQVYDVLTEQYHEYRYKFLDNVEIGSLYDSPGGSWNGGRLRANRTDYDELVEIKEIMDTWDIPIRFTATNCLITEDNVRDTYSEAVFDLFNTGKNEIIVNSLALEKFLRERYGDSYKYISSTTKMLRKPNLIEEELDKDYAWIVLDYVYNNNFSFIKELPHKDKLEILVNPVCNRDCQRRNLHYELLSEAQLKEASRDPASLWEEPCNAPYKTFCEVLENPVTVTRENIEKYLDLGINNFKIEGRTSHIIDLVEALLYYLIKPEYQTEIRIAIFRRVW